MNALRRLAVITLLSTAFLPAAAFAQQPFAGCPDEFWSETPPVVSGTGVADALCSAHFATLYSETTETPLYSAERLTPQQITDAIHQRRENRFHEDERLPPAVASTLSDYRRSGYDRGHMAPSGDEPNAFSQYESFSLSNVVPQNANDNRGIWSDIEMAVRQLVLAGGDTVYAVTGAIFGQIDPPALHGRVQVPELLFKAVYDETIDIAGVYVVENVPGKRYWSLSLQDFKERYGIHPFPALAASIMQMKGKIPPPAADNRFAGKENSW